jgi:signal peptidase I
MIGHRSSPNVEEGTHRKKVDVVGVISTCVLSVLVTCLLALLAGTLLGYRAFTIRSGSMVPTIGVGDVVVDRTVSPLSVRPGQIVTFRDPALGQQLVTHRVLSVHRSGELVRFVTKGDANLVTEHWSVPTTGQLGRELLVLPGLGRVFASIGSPLGRVLVIALASLCLAFFGLRRIWRIPAAAMTGQLT